MIKNYYVFATDDMSNTDK